MIVADFTTLLEEFAPLVYQEDYDNAGLIVGNLQHKVTGVIIALDCVEEVLDEAISTECNLIVSHHPIVFKGMKKFVGSTYAERVIMKAIKHNINLYAIHTNLDNVKDGVNAAIAKRLNLMETQVLAPKGNILRKLAVFVPKSHAAELRGALFAAGAGHIGNYSNCSFNQEGIGTFKAGEDTDPFVGQIGKQHQEAETRIELIYPINLERKILLALYQHHPYDEIAYDIYPIKNTYQQIGSGIIGNLSAEMPETAFLATVKAHLKVAVIRYTALLDKPIRRVAVCGGAGSFLLNEAIRAGADIFITADFKYHEFFDADKKVVIADIGHFESEQFTQHLLLEIITKKIPNFAVRLTTVNTNPIKYYF